MEDQFRSVGPSGWQTTVAVACVLGAATAGCTTDDAQPAGNCVPGKTETCPCPSGTDGTQTCSTDGQGFGACDCLAPDTADAVSDKDEGPVPDEGPVADEGPPQDAPECTPDCAGAECGDDGCGGSCGACSDGEGCVDRQCASTLPDPPCDGGQYGFHDGHAFAFCDGSFDRQNAVSDCASIDFELVPVADETTNTWLVTTAKQLAPGAKKVWIGARFENGAWVWEDGSAADYTEFNDTFQPKGERESRGVLTLTLNAEESENTDDYDGLWYAPPDAGFAAGYVCRSKTPLECKPECANAECGDDGCGGTCGACSDGEACENGTCVSPQDEECAVLQLDGEDDQVFLGEQENMLGIGNAFSIAGWIRRADDDGHFIFDGEGSWSGSKSQNAGVRLLLRGGGQVEGFYGTGAESDGPSLKTDTGAIPINEWAHIAFTRDGGNVRIYINGVQTAASDSMGAQDVNWNGAGFDHAEYRLGAGWSVDSASGTEIHTNGSLHDVAVWRRALSEAEVTTLLTSGPGALPAELAAWWPLDEGEGSSAKDHAGSADGVLQAGATWSTPAASNCPQ